MAGKIGAPDNTARRISRRAAPDPADRHHETPSRPYRRLALGITLACGLALPVNSIHAAVPGSVETVNGLKAALSRGGRWQYFRQDPVATGSAIIKKIFGSRLK